MPCCTSRSSCEAVFVVATLAMVSRWFSIDCCLEQSAIVRRPMFAPEWATDGASLRVGSCKGRCPHECFGRLWENHCPFPLYADNSRISEPNMTVPSLNYMVFFGQPCSHPKCLALDIQGADVLSVGAFRREIHSV